MAVSVRQWFTCKMTSCSADWLKHWQPFTNLFENDCSQSNLTLTNWRQVASHQVTCFIALQFKASHSQPEGVAWWVTDWYPEVTNCNSLIGRCADTDYGPHLKDTEMFLYSYKQPLVMSFADNMWIFIFTFKSCYGTVQNPHQCQGEK